MFEKITSEEKYNIRVAIMLSMCVLCTAMVLSVDEDCLRIKGYDTPEYQRSIKSSAAMCMLPAIDSVLDMITPRTKKLTIVERYQGWLMWGQLVTLFSIAYYAIPQLNWVVFNIMTSLSNLIALPCIFYIFNEFAPDIWSNATTEVNVWLCYVAAVAQIFGQKYSIGQSVHASLSSVSLVLFYVGFFRSMIHHRSVIYNVCTGKTVASTTQLLFFFYQIVLFLLYTIYIVISFYPSPTDIVGTSYLNTIFNLSLGILPRRLAAQEVALSEAALLSNRAFVQYISHEARGPLQIAVMGLQLYEKKLAALTFNQLKNAPRRRVRIHKHHASSTTSECSSSTDCSTTSSSDDGSMGTDTNTESDSVATSMHADDAVAPIGLAVADRASWYRSTRAKLQEIVVACRTSQSVLTNMLIYEKLQDGKLQVERERFDVLGFVDHCVHIFDIPATYRNVRIHSYHCKRHAGTPLEHAALFADRSKLQLAVRSFISNAMKFTPDGGDLAVNVWFLRRFSKEVSSLNKHTSNDAAWNPSDESGGQSLDEAALRNPSNLLEGDFADVETISREDEISAGVAAEIASTRASASGDSAKEARTGHVICRVEIQYAPHARQTHAVSDDERDGDGDEAAPVSPPATCPAPMPEDKVNRILRCGDDQFDPGSRFLKRKKNANSGDDQTTDAPRDRGDGGVGLGLWLAKSSVELHGGVVGAIDLRASDGPTPLDGKATYYGSALFLELPLCNMKPLEEPSALGSAARPGTSTPQGLYRRKKKA